MRRNHWSRFFTLAGGLALVAGLQPFAAAAQQPQGDLVKTYIESQGQGRPDWVAVALEQSKSYLRSHGQAQGISNVDAELTLRNAIQDDLKQTHLRLDQTHNGVPVFGGQLVTQLVEGDVVSVGGRIYESARIDTTPRLSSKLATRAAIDALGYRGEFARTPEAKLVVLPNRDGTEGATLTYKVELAVEDGTDKTGR
ncbi:MAG: hypothetical protein JOZ51_15905, partial [Chloroflexi bacterium]|nr:hypothetical protein [Chloroflexota bacterium]